MPGLIFQQVFRIEKGYAWTCPSQDVDIRFWSSHLPGSERIKGDDDLFILEVLEK